MEQTILETNNLHSANREGPPQRDYKGCCDPWRWFAEKPMKRWRFLVFFIFGCLTFIWLILFVLEPWNPSPYVFAGILCILMSGWACNHFRILTKLTEQVDRLYRLNLDFDHENSLLRKEVLTLANTETHLHGVQTQIGALNRKLKENIVKFQELDRNLRTISDSNIAGIEKIKSKSKVVVDSMHESLIRHEKAILHAVYESLEWNNQMNGLNHAQFDLFWSKLPSSYYQRFERTGKSFEQIAGRDGVLDYRKFTALVDELAKQEALSGLSK